MGYVARIVHCVECVYVHNDELVLSVASQYVGGGANEITTVMPNPICTVTRAGYTHAPDIIEQDTCFNFTGAETPEFLEDSPRPRGYFASESVLSTHPTLLELKAAT